MQRKSTYREWMEAEHSGRDDLAELAFARLVAQLPPVEASAGFVDAVVLRAARARARRRLVTRVARVAAAVLVTVATIAAMYALGGVVVNGIARGSVILADGLLWLLTSAGQGVRWWSLAARVGSAIGNTLITPQTIIALVLIELVGASAIYALQRMVRDDHARDSSQVQV